MSDWSEWLSSYWSVPLSIIEKDLVIIIRFFQWRWQISCSLRYNRISLIIKMILVLILFCYMTIRFTFRWRNYFVISICQGLFEVSCQIISVNTDCSKSNLVIFCISFSKSILSLQIGITIIILWPIGRDILHFRRSTSDRSFHRRQGPNTLNPNIFVKIVKTDNCMRLRRYFLSWYWNLDNMENQWDVALFRHSSKSFAENHHTRK